MAEFVKIVVFVPTSHAEKIREVLAHAGAGHVGNYDFCSFSVKGVGRFRPQKGAKPFIGKEGKVDDAQVPLRRNVAPLSGRPSNRAWSSETKASMVLRDQSEQAASKRQASGEEQVAEERIETICPRSKLKKVLAAVKAEHPYEEPAIDVYALLID